MARAVLGVIVGYIVMAVLVVIMFSVAYLGMGTDRAFKTGTYDPSLLWIVVSLVLGLIAAIAGGWVCAMVARPGSKAPKVLAGIVVVAGLAMAGLSAAKQPPPEVRSGAVSNFEAMQRARTPLWVALTNPIVGAIGIVIGAGLRGRPPAGP
jgi:hypothetical protein